MKKFLMLLLCAMLMFSFVACDEPEQPLPHEHSWDNGTVTTEATCTTTGVKTYKCACGETKTEIIAALGHDWNGGDSCTRGDAVKVVTEEDLNVALSNSTIEMVYLKEDITVYNQITITRKVILDGEGKTITRKTPTEGTVSDKSIILVSKTDGVEIKNLNVSGTGTQTAWNDGEFGIKVWESTNTVLENVSVTKTNAGIQVNSSDVVVKGTITLDGNTYGGIGVDKSSTSTDLGSLVIDGANIVCSSEKVPAIWLESADKAAISGEAGLTKAILDTKNGQIYYFTNTQDKWIESYNIIGRIDDNYYTNLETMAMASENKTIVLLSDVDIPGTIDIGWKLTLDANGHKVYNSINIWNERDKKWSLFSIKEGGDLTVKGNGTFAAKENDCYAFDVFDETAKLTIVDGTVIGNIHAVYVLEGEAVIQGGTYSVQQKYSEEKPYDFTLNLFDANGKTGKAKIAVSGGKFYKFNPGDLNCEPVDSVASFLVEGYSTIEEGDYYIVTK